MHKRILHSTSNIHRPRRFSTYGYTQAKSLVYAKNGNPTDVLSLHTHSIGPPHSSLLTLRTLSAPLNPADINQIQGTYPTAPPFTSTLGTTQPTAVPGNEACFEVLAAGSGVKNVKKGDWVIAKQTGLGTWRTHLQIEEGKIMRVEKEGLRSEQVGTVGVNPVTAYRMLKDFVKLDDGDWWIQNGANSGVGRAAIQLGKRWGYNSIAVVRSRPGEEGEKLKRELEDLGATKVVTDEEIQQDGFKDQVKEWTNGGRSPLKLALNCVGGNAAMAMARPLSSGACMVTYGGMSKKPMLVGASMLIFKDIRFSGFWVSRWSDAHPEEKTRTVDELLDMMRKGDLKDTPMVEVTWNWDTKKEELVDAVQGTLDGFRKGKGVFVFGDM
ncbi:hypothetical protein BDR22DRAFT_878219 [Usnea florida]